MIIGRPRALGALLALLVLVGTPAAGQQAGADNVKKELEALRRSVTAMQKDLQEIKALLQTRPPAGAAPAAAPAENVVIELRDNPSRGQRTAPLTLVEFSDYQCPFCARHVRGTAALIEKDYVATGKVRHVFLDLPIESLHPLAFRAAEAAFCAGEQGKYWEMHDRLFANQQAFEPWAPHTAAVGLDATTFDACLKSDRPINDVRKDIAEAQKLGLTGTPSFVLAYTDPKTSQVKTVARVIGAQPYAAFKAQMDRLLAEVAAGGKTLEK
jgi:protein-disulfide isomerase